MGGLMKKSKKELLLQKQAFQKISPVQQKRTISIHTKTCPQMSCVVGSPFWIQMLDNQQENGKHLEATEMSFLRRMLGASWTSRENNEWIMKRMKWKKCLLNTI